MSLYNALFGVNPQAGICLQALGISRDDVPRFRDAWITESGKIAIHTRTGGGNRDMYEHVDRARANYPEYFDGGNDPAGPWNSDLRKLRGFEYDEDDDFDSTYATFYFDPSPEWKKIISTMAAIAGGAPAPKDRWEQLIAELKSAGPKTDEAKRALEFGRTILGKLDGSEP